MATVAPCQMPWTMNYSTAFHGVGATCQTECSYVRSNAWTNGQVKVLDMNLVSLKTSDGRVAQYLRCARGRYLTRHVCRVVCTKSAGLPYPAEWNGALALIKS